MLTIIRRFFPALAAGSVLFGSLAFAAVPAYAAGPGSFPRPAVVGTVASVSGNTLTVTSRVWQRGAPAGAPATTTYTVNASGATVTKDGQSSSISAISVGDFVAIQGTVNGTDVTATSIRDGMMGGPRGVRGSRDDWRGRAIASTTPPIQGNGDPVIGGTVSAISGSTLTVTAKAGQTYAVDASNAKFTKPGVTDATLASVSVGDSVVIQGTVNGSSVTASSVLDQPAAVSGSGSGNPPRRGLFGAIGGFFTRIFGFF